jgi:hypothetical protein
LSPQRDSHAAASAFGAASHFLHIMQCEQNVKAAALVTAVVSVGLGSRATLARWNRQGLACIFINSYAAGVASAFGSALHSECDGHIVQCEPTVKASALVTAVVSVG